MLINLSCNQSWSPAYSFILERGRNECVFCLWMPRHFPNNIINAYCDMVFLCQNYNLSPTLYSICLIIKLTRTELYWIVSITHSSYWYSLFPLITSIVIPIDRNCVYSRYVIMNCLFHINGISSWHKLKYHQSFF